MNFKRCRGVGGDGIGKKMGGSNINIVMSEILRSFKFKNGSTKYFFFSYFYYIMFCAQVQSLVNNNLT